MIELFRYFFLRKASGLFYKHNSKTERNVHDLCLLKFGPHI